MEVEPIIQLIVQKDADACSLDWSHKMSQLYGNLGTQGACSPTDRSHTSPFLRKITSSIKKDQSCVSLSDKVILKRLVRKNRVSRLVDSFVAKIKRGVAFQKPVDQGLEGEFLVVKNREGLVLNQYLHAVLGLFSVFLTFGVSILYTLCLIFPEAEGTTAAAVLKISSALFFSMQFVLQFLAKKTVEGKTLNSCIEISKHYLRQEFAPDAINLIVVLISLSEFENDTAFHLLRLMALWKVSQVGQKLQPIEKILITNFNREQYMGLLSILVMNVCFAHILSIVMNGMTIFSPENNWLTQKQIMDRPWYERYVWGYYWGTTVMLTVGFGDLAATNFQEALCLIFIELVSCMTLSYNINCLGNLISDLRRRHLDKKKDVKTLHLMSRKNQVSEQLQNRINNFIQGSFLIKQEFNFVEQDQLLESLPTDMREQFMIESNRNIFKNLAMLKNFTLRTQELMAKHIIKKVCHPQELLVKKGEPMKLFILQKGEIGLCARFHQTMFSIITDRIRIEKKQEPKLLSLGFIKSKNIICDIKSLTYSILFYLSNEELTEILRQSKMDYEHYCTIRDRDTSMLNENELYKCPNCPREFHNKLICPKLHYIPVRSHIIHKYLLKLDLNRNCRMKFNRRVVCQNDLKNKSDLLVQAFRLRMENGSMYDHETSISHELIKPAAAFRNNSISSKNISAENNNVEDDHQSANDMWDVFKSYLHRQDQVNFWKLEVDKMCNWRYYMADGNPENLLTRSKRRLAKHQTERN